MSNHTGRQRENTGRVALMVKFYEDERDAEAFRRGQLYARRLKGFREMEDPLRGDRYEGGVLSEGGTLSIQGSDGNWWPIPTVGPHAFFSGWTDALSVFCMTGFMSEEASGPELGMVKDVMAQVKESSDTCAAMGRHAVMVQNFDEFMRRATQACDRRGFRLWARPVEYYGAYPPESVFWPDGSIKPVFLKSAGYRLQREYRLAFDTGTYDSEPITLEIGDIRDISFLMATENLPKLQWRIRGEIWAG